VKLEIGLVTTSGQKVVFWGRNKFGWWFGINFIPHKFGVMIYSLKENK